MPKQDSRTAEVNKGEEVFDVTFVANHQPAAVEQPGKEAFDLSPAELSSQLPAVLGPLALSSFSVGGVEEDSLFFKQPLVELVTVVGPVSNEPCGGAFR